MSATKAFNVYINGHCINRVYHTPNTQPDEVRLSLINHDGYDPNIKVRVAKTGEPCPPLSKKYSGSGHLVQRRR